MVCIKTHIFNNFYEEYLVLLTMVPRNTLKSNTILSDMGNTEDDNGYTMILNRMLWKLEYQRNEGVDCSSIAGKIATCKLLIQCGADVNVGRTPPHRGEVKPLQLVNDILSVGSFEEDFLDLFQCMVDNGADINNIEGSGGGYLIEGCDVGVTRILTFSGRLDTIKGRPFFGHGVFGGGGRSFAESDVSRGGRVYLTSIKE